MNKKVACYIRVSTDNQTTQNQRRELEAYCNRQGWKITKFYDDTCSGSKSDRPALKQMLADSVKGKIQAVVCWKIDRLARSTSDLLNILLQLKQAGVDFVSATQAIDTTTAYGKMVLTFLGAIAEFEKDTIIERVRVGMARAKADGIRIGRPKVEVDIAQARKLQEQGMGYKQIAKIMGIPKSTLYGALNALSGKAS